MPKANSPSDMLADRSLRTTRPLTQLDRVLVSLGRSSNWSTEKVPYEDLVLQAWRDWPGVFSLRNHPEYPDASDVHKALYDLKPAALVVGLGNKIFRLSDKGVERARQIEAALKNAPQPMSSSAKLSREQQDFLRNAVVSRAFETWKAGARDRLIDFDARIFFQFSTGTPIEKRRVQVRFANEAAEKAADLGIDQAADTLALARFLSDKFSHLWKGKTEVENGRD